MIYTDCDDGEIECPACGAEFKRETWEMQIGSETECKACEVVLEVTEIDYSRTLYWSTRDDVRWRAFCRIWGAIGAAHRSESINREGLTWDEWRRAAGSFGAVEVSRNEWRDAWAAGEDPTEYANGHRL